MSDQRYFSTAEIELADQRRRSRHRALMKEQSERSFFQDHCQNIRRASPIIWPYLAARMVSEALTAPLLWVGFAIQDAGLRYLESHLDTHLDEALLHTRVCHRIVRWLTTAPGSALSTSTEDVVLWEFLPMPFPSEAPSFPEKQEVSGTPLHPLKSQKAPAHEQSPQPAQTHLRKPDNKSHPHVPVLRSDTYLGSLRSLALSNPFVKIVRGIAQKIGDRNA